MECEFEYSEKIVLGKFNFWDEYLISSNLFTNTPLNNGNECTWHIMYRLRVDNKLLFRLLDKVDCLVL